MTVRTVDGCHYFGWRIGALDRYRVQTDLRDGPAPVENMQDIPHRCPAGRRHHSNAQRVSGQGLFARRVKKPLGFEFLLHFLELAAQQTLAGILQAIHDHLKITAWLIQADPAPGQDLHSIFGPDAQTAGCGTKQRAADLRLVIFQGEVQMARCGTGQVRYLSFQQDSREAHFDVQAHFAVEFAGGVDLLAAYRHAQMITSAAPE